MFVTCLLSASPAWSGDLADIFRSPEIAGLELAPIGPALANTVSSAYPVASASSSVSYVFNPQTETFERQTRVLGPIIGERAESVGERQLDISVSYSYVDLSTINGTDLGDLVNRPRLDQRVISFPVTGGVLLNDGRFTNFLPVRVHADIDVEADIASPSMTYGVTPDLDVNLSLPIVKTFLGVKVRGEVPDPRLPEFMLRDCDPDLPEGDPNRCALNEIRPTTLHVRDFGHATGVGDLLMRAKYVLLRGRPASLAAALGVSFPTGDDGDFHGSGNYRVQPSLIVSRVLADRFEPLLNLGFDLNAEDIDRSAFRWAVGGTASLIGPFAGAVVFLGRNDFAAQSDKIRAPFFFQVERNDVYDASLGLRWLFAENGVVSANVLLPLNRDGLRADLIPTLAAEYVFASPW